MKILIHTKNDNEINFVKNFGFDTFHDYYKSLFTLSYQEKQVAKLSDEEKERFILKGFRKNIPYKYLLVFNEVFNSDGLIKYPLNQKTLDNVITTVKTERNYESLMICENQIGRMWYRKKEGMLDFLKKHEINSVGIQFHYKYNPSFIILPLLENLINFFTSNNIKTHLCEVSIWEPNETKQANLLQRLLDVGVRTNCETFCYWYLEDSENNKAPYKPPSLLPGLISKNSKKIHYKKAWQTLINYKNYLSN